MIRIAEINHTDDKVHEVSLCISDVDRETRETMIRNRTLSQALSAAEESSKAKTTFLSNMSHEIRTPMNAIIGLDLIALRDPDLSPETRSNLEKIGVSANHLLNLINDILDMSRIESGHVTLKKEEFSLPEVLEQVNTIIGNQCSEKQLEFTSSVLTDIDDFYLGDEVKLKQILINILGNAVKFTPEGGTIDFTTERTMRFDGKSTLRFVIRDTGIGMDNEFIPHLFDAFSQENSSAINRHGSTGLGMAITKSFVDMMNGKIEVESEKGKGTAFFVTITLTDSATSASDNACEECPIEMGVLVADPDKSEREKALLTLEQIGIKVETASSGKKAIELAALRHAHKEPYHLIILDSKLPDFNGGELVRRVCSAAGRSSAVIITADGEYDIDSSAMSEIADGVLKKPISQDELCDKLRAVLKAKSETYAKLIRKADLRGKRVLLAEDTEINAEIMKMILSEREMEVELAVNGREAVDMFSAHPEGYYSVILMDMRMPEMDGLTATTVIRDMDRDDARSIPIIALTANAFDEDVQRSLQSGLNAHLSKPIVPEKLFATMESLITD